jgi:hypothetical protein
MRRLLLITFFVFASACAQAERPDPKKQIEAFLSALSTSGPRTAVDALVEGTLLKQQKGAQIEALIPQFEAALKIYGSIDRTEYVDEKRFGDSFARFRFVTYHSSDAPLFWQFMFFKAKIGWQVYIFRFNDQFEAVFKDA